MSVARSILLFALAAVAEIGGAWMVWQGVREHRGLAWIGAGVAALFHNRQRRHSSLGMLSPIEYERRHQPSVRVQAS